MDSSMWTFCCSTNGSEFDHEFDSNNSDTNDVWDLPLTSNIPDPVIHSGYLSQRSDRGSAKENDFSDAILSYINQVLMEDDLEDEVCMIQHPTIHAAEQSLYEILSKKDQSSSTQWQTHEGAKSSSDDSITHCRSNCSSCSNSSLELVTTSELNKSKSCHVHDAYVDQTMLTNSESFCSPTRSCHTAAGMVGSLVNAPNKEVEEKEECKMLKDVGHLRQNLKRGNSLHREESDYLEEERKKKHLVVCDEEYILSEMFDKVLSMYGKNDRCASRTRNIALQNDESKQIEPAKSFFGERTCTTKGVRKKKAIDLRSLLIQCMQSVARNDHRSASNQLKQIRLRSSPLGDGSQRLAHYFANSLEARLHGKEKYKSLTSVMSDVDVLKAYELHLFVLPFMETFCFFAGQVIMKLAEKAATIHIIQFGIVHGIEWLPLIQRLSIRPGGPPKLRITAINLPHHGIRPAARVKDTGCRFVKYCEMFNIPFEYKGISQQWETVSIEDLGIEKDEILVVNCLYQFMYLLDDTIMEQSPRDAVLKLIRRICPDVFIHAILNGTYNSPFFVTRFKDALFHYSAMFDMFEANLPPENQERMVFERDILGNQFLNVIACEGLERVIRPETYKQWQTRTFRAGFRQLPISPEIMKELKAKVKSCYHKDFFVDEASQWLLSGWKGRVLVAFSCWKPA